MVAPRCHARRSDALCALGLDLSVAERSFSLLDRVKILIKPMAQPLLRNRRWLQEKTRKTQGLEDFKRAPRIGNDMRPATAQLFKGKPLPRLVRKTAPRLRVAKQMIQALAQDHRRNIKHDLTVARCTQFFELPAATFHWLIILFNLWTLFVVAHDPWPREPLICGHQDHMVQDVLFPVPLANHTGIERHVTRLPQVLHAFDKGDGLVGA